MAVRCAASAALVACALLFVGAQVTAASRDLSEPTHGRQLAAYDVPGVNLAFAKQVLSVLAILQAGGQLDPTVDLYAVQMAVQTPEDIKAVVNGKKVKDIVQGSTTDTVLQGVVHAADNTVTSHTDPVAAATAILAAVKAQDTFAQAGVGAATVKLPGGLAKKIEGALPAVQALSKAADISSVDAATKIMTGILGG